MGILRTIFGTTVPDLGAIQTEVGTKIRREQQAQDAGKLDLQRLPVLEQELEMLTERVRHHEDILNALAPEVGALSSQARAAREKFETTKSQIGNLRGVQDALVRLQRDAERAEDDYRTIQARFDRNSAVFNATHKLVEEFNKVHGAELKALRELDQRIDPNGHRRFHSVREGTRTGPVQALADLKALETR